MQTNNKKIRPVKFPPVSINVFKSSDEIADFIKEDRNKVPWLVKNEGLPAWKRNGSGPWRALNVDLYDWLIRQRNKYLKNALQDADAEENTPA